MIVCFSLLEELLMLEQIGTLFVIAYAHSFAKTFCVMLLLFYAPGLLLSLLFFMFFVMQRRARQIRSPFG
jgi:hypothetical protein